MVFGILIIGTKNKPLRSKDNEYINNNKHSIKEEIKATSLNLVIINTLAIIACKITITFSLVIIVTKAASNAAFIISNLSILSSIPFILSMRN